MKMDYKEPLFQYQEEEEEEEDTISLSDFTLTPDHHTDSTTQLSAVSQNVRSQLKQSEVFEFSSDHHSNTLSHAEDIIYCGKLVPFNYQDDQLSPSNNSATNINHHKRHNFEQRRSESLPDLKAAAQSTSTYKNRMRSSRSLDNQKLSRNSSMSSDSPDARNHKGSYRFDGTSIKIPKPRWYIIMFGSLRFPPEMDLRDIKNRQVHGTGAVPLFPSLEVVKKVPVNRKCTWEVLKVLSCRDDVSVHVTTSHLRLPRV